MPAGKTSPKAAGRTPKIPKPKPQRVRSLIEISTARRALGRLKNDLYCTLQDLVVIKGPGDVLEIRILGGDRRSSGVPGAI